MTKSMTKCSLHFILINIKSQFLPQRCYLISANFCIFIPRFIIHISERNMVLCSFMRGRKRWYPENGLRLSCPRIVPALISRPGKQNARDTPSRETKHSLPPAGPGVVHLKGPFISTCVYCPSCVWPRISLLRFVSPLQRSQCISPALRRGRIWHFDVVPRKGRREINDYAQRTQVRARARGGSQTT